MSGKILSRLHQAMQEVLNEAIQARGTSVRSYVDPAGALGAKLSIPFRLIMAYNPLRSGVLDNNYQPAKKFTFKFAVGTTF